MNMYDIHMHIIHGVDDGSWNLEMSQTLLDMAYRQGVRTIMATSHSSAFMDKDNKVKDKFKELQEMMIKKFPEIQIYMGCEILCDCYNMDFILEKLKSRQFPSLNETKYVLTEFWPSVTPDEALECTKKLLEDGWIPVIAHVERYKKLFRDTKWIATLQEMGCLFQINVYSIYEERDEVIKRNAHYLIEEKIATFLGSDAHRTFHRPPMVQSGLQYLYDNYDSDYIDQISFKNAEKLLNRKEGTKSIPKELTQFTGEQIHLAMKSKCCIVLDDIEFENLTSAWLSQAVSEEYKYEFACATHKQARKVYQEVPHLEDWEERKYHALYEATKVKYEQNLDLCKKLLSTEDMVIIYDTTGGHDNELGRCLCKECQQKGLDGKNIYGKILMQVRSELKK